MNYTLDGSSWLVLGTKNTFFASAIFPNDVTAKLASLRDHNNTITNVLFMPDASGWLILCENNVWESDGELPEGCIPAMQELVSGGSVIKDVAFDYKGGWIVVCNENKWRSSGIPQDCQNAITNLVNSGSILKRVVFAPPDFSGFCDTWLVIGEKNAVYFSPDYDKCTDRQRIEYEIAHNPSFALDNMSFLPGGVDRLFIGENNVYMPSSQYDRDLGILQAIKNLVNSGSVLRAVVHGGPFEPSGRQGDQQGVGVAIKKGREESRSEGNEQKISPEPGFVCVTRQVTITESYSDALLLDPQSDVVWPGSIIDGGHWVTGEYRAITDERAPMTISLSLDTFNHAPVSTIIDKPSLSAVREALNNLRANLRGVSYPARINAEYSEVHSKEQLQLALSGSFDNGAYKLATKFSFDGSKANNRVLLKYQQIYFTVDVDLPGSGSDVFASKREPRNGEMIISSVTYGRMFLLTVDSMETSETIKAGVDAAVRAYNITASLQMQYSRMFTQSTMNLLALGGSAANAEPIIVAGDFTTVAAMLRRYIQSGGTYDEHSGAVPLSYRMRFLRTFDIGNIVLTTNFVQRSCAKVTGTILVNNISIKCNKVSDEFLSADSVELYGRVFIWCELDNGEDHLVTGHQSATVFNLTRDEYWSLAENDVKPLNNTMSWTISDFSRVRDHVVIKAAGGLMDADSSSDDDPIKSDGTGAWYINNLKPNADGTLATEVTLHCSGDGNEVDVIFTIDMQ